ncbi:GNAT family N-acetyltransferase [Aequorivita echinoideorum]|uniref:GNAT family N-acetyltransferase n=1 Tax=Aequorivita echinoideorum TaxID=1549647 RepID=A0ABS5S5V2_9FLAO|nr:GNAT family N-acetyltransferase [Aequorivita echinoideorum]MBT0608578.1 GNAT family N-acetyltransferase [Aequorivita echinoideorum]
MTLRGTKIFLRALEVSDLDFLYELENDETLWEVSNTTTPYSKFVLKQYLENAHRDIYDVKQLRLVICEKETNLSIGFVDLYDFDPKHKRVGLGIVIFSEEDKQRGFAAEAIHLISEYVFSHLDAHQIFAGITEDNLGSIRLFEKCGFKRTGEKKDWIFSNGKFKNEYLYQLLNH